MRSDEDTEREKESRRILGRAERDAGPSSPGGAPEDADAIERLGIRIGRVLAIALTVAVIGWGVLYLIRNS